MSNRRIVLGIFVMMGVILIGLLIYYSKTEPHFDDHHYHYLIECFNCPNNTVFFSINNTKTITFRGCNLKNANLCVPEIDRLEIIDAKLEKITRNQFGRCDNLKSLIIIDRYLVLEEKALSALAIQFLELRVGVEILTGDLLPKNLKILKIGDNIEEIRNDAFEELTSLEVLDLGNNKINDLGRSLEQLKHLRELNLKHNPLENFSVQSLASLENLRKIGLPGEIFLANTDWQNFKKLKTISIHFENFGECMQQFGEIVNASVHISCTYDL